MQGKKGTWSLRAKKKSLVAAHFGVLRRKRDAFLYGFALHFLLVDTSAGLVDHGVAKAADFIDRRAILNLF